MRLQSVYQKGSLRVCQSCLFIAVLCLSCQREQKENNTVQQSIADSPEKVKDSLRIEPSIPDTPELRDTLKPPGSVKQKKEPERWGRITVKKGIQHDFWTFAHEFVSYRDKVHGQVADTINGQVYPYFHPIMYKKYPVPIAVNLWLNTYYVPYDSIDSWYNKGVITGQYVHVKGLYDGLLQNRITLHFKREISVEEREELMKRFGLKPLSNWSVSPLEMSMSLENPRADKISTLSASIAKLDYVDWVENHIHTGEPVRTDNWP